MALPMPRFELRYFGADEARMSMNLRSEGGRFGDVAALTSYPWQGIFKSQSQSGYNVTGRGRQVF